MNRWITCLLLLFSVTVQPASSQRNNVLYLKGGTIIDLTGRPPHKANLLIRDGRIVEMATDTAATSDAHVVDVSGNYILPGFIDMHAHVTYLRGDTYDSYDRKVSEQVLKALLAYGITTVRNPAAPAVQAVKLRDDANAGTILGPRILTAGESLNGRPFVTEAEIRAEVKRQAMAGVNYIKVYANSTPQQTAIAIDEAHKHGLKVIGHLQATDWPTAAEEGIDFVTHGVCWSKNALPADKRSAYEAEVRRVGAMKARIFWLENVQVYGPEMDRIIRSLKQHRISDDPTLIAYVTKFVPDQQYRGERNVGLAPKALQAGWKDGGLTADWTEYDFARMRKAWPKMLQIVARYHNEGVLLTTGSDLPNTWVVPGISLHQEMELLSQAGISNADILEMATRNGASALGLASEIGTIETGKRADLVVLTANPLTDIRNSRSIQYVISNGRLLRPKDLTAN